MSHGKEEPQAVLHRLRENYMQHLRLTTELAERVEGRTTAPSAEELRAHRRTGGWWQWVVTRDEKVLGGVMRGPTPPTEALTGCVIRYWAFAHDGTLAAWPTVTP